MKEPEQPKGYYEAQRELDRRAEKKEIETSGFSRNDLGVVKERATAILEGVTPPGGASATEKSAVSAKSAELSRCSGSETKPAPGSEAAAARLPLPHLLPPAARSPGDVARRDRA